MAEQAVSPMMQQYFEIKKQHPNEILFYRVGDFYEMFYDDALTASRELELTLTGKNCGKEERAPMCGVPFHSYETYMARLVAKGYTKEANFISWNGNAAKLDIREWHPNHERCGKGITLTKDEGRNLYAALKAIYEKE